MYTLLILQGYAVVLGLGAWMAYRYLTLKEDLVSPWFLFLGGCMCFLGMPSIFTGMGGPLGHREPFSEWILFLFLLGILVFMVTLMATYYLFNYPAKLAQRAQLLWPSPSIGTLLVALVLCFGMYAFFLRPLPIPFVSHVLGISGAFGPIIAVSLAVVAWNNDKANPFLIAIAIGTLGLALICSVASGSGRRQLVAVLLTVPIMLYWLRWRYQNPQWTAVRFVALGLAGLVVISAYSGLRHGTRGEVGFGTGLNRITAISSSIASGNIGDGANVFAADTTETSLLAIWMYGHNRPFPHQPFHTLYFIAANPIPRVFWEEKPKGLGYLLPQEHYELEGSSATLGPGVVGHAFHEGGLHMCIFYGALFAIILRFGSEWIRLEPGNPYLLGIFAAASSNILTIPRGDMGTMTMQVLSSAVCGAVVFGVMRLLSPTSNTSYRIDQLYAPQPQPPQLQAA
ncbi:MAG: hypothetical protein AAF823_12980 [Planctomycetota bacterium]